MTTPNLILTPRRPALLAGHHNEVDVLVRIQAPDAPAGQCKRNPLHLALVIDRSGSMSGEPLHEAKRCAEFVLDGLQSTDRLSVVAYDDDVHTLVPTTTLVDKEPIRRAIRQVDSGGSTDLHGGWFRGAENLAPHTGDGVTSRVILLSDGCANHGLQDPAAINAQCAEFAVAGISTSTYGLGNHFNEELMIGMARHGQGNTYYGRTAEDLMDPFREEFELLNALCARQLRLEVAAVEGVEVKVLNDYVAVGENAWQLPDLAFGGEAWAVLRLRTQAGAPVADARALVSVSVRYQTLDGEPRAIQPLDLALPTLPVAAFHAIVEDDLVVRRVGELEAASLQAEARTAARQRDWARVGVALKSAERIGAQNPWVAEVVKELRDLAAQKDHEAFAKEAAYSGRRMSSRLAARCEAPVMDAATPESFLRRKAAQGKGKPDSRQS